MDQNPIVPPPPQPSFQDILFGLAQSAQQESTRNRNTRYAVYAMLGLTLLGRIPGISSFLGPILAPPAQTTAAPGK